MLQAPPPLDSIVDIFIQIQLGPLWRLQIYNHSGIYPNKFCYLYVFHQVPISIMLSENNLYVQLCDVIRMGYILKNIPDIMVNYQMRGSKEKEVEEDQYRHTCIIFSGPDNSDDLYTCKTKSADWLTGYLQPSAAEAAYIFKLVRCDYSKMFLVILSGWHVLWTIWQTLITSNIVFTRN